MDFWGGVCSGQEHKVFQHCRVTCPQTHWWPSLAVHDVRSVTISAEWHWIPLMWATECSRGQGEVCSSWWPLADKSVTHLLLCVEFFSEGSVGSKRGLSLPCVEQHSCSQKELLFFIESDGSRSSLEYRHQCFAFLSFWHRHWGHYENSGCLLFLTQEETTFWNTSRKFGDLNKNATEKLKVILKVYREHWL